MDIIFSITMGCVSRVCGSYYKWWGLPLYTLPYSLIVYFVTDNILLTLLATIWVFMWKLTGHGDAFMNFTRDNTLSKILVPITNYIGIVRDSKMYDNIFWGLKGYLIALLPAILINSFWLCLFSTIAYPIAYRIGYDILGVYSISKNKQYIGAYNTYTTKKEPAIYLPKFLRFYPTVWGEFISGFIASIGFWFI